MDNVFSIIINCVISIGAHILTYRIIPRVKDVFIEAGLFGIDLNKSVKKRVPEALGVITGCVFLITLFLFIPIPFGQHIVKTEDFPHHKLVEFVVALLSTCCMLLLGFADDVLDLKWRYKLLLPTIASLPLLMVYYVTLNSTTIILPRFLRFWFGISINLGILYYVYIGMLAVFCTNAINIFAGINGLEVGQSVVIASSVAVFNLIELHGSVWASHQFSLYFIVPYIATSCALLRHNWYPSEVFVGNTFCYFSGMTFAVVGILGHFGKTMLLFFIPQVVNFVYSIPQLFHILPCPRHRMPRYNQQTDKLEVSVVTLKKSELTRLAKFYLYSLQALNLIQLKENVEEKEEYVEFSNLTLINFVLICNGPTQERTLTNILLISQVFCSLIAFAIRYPLVSFFYDA